MTPGFSGTRNKSAPRRRPHIRRHNADDVATAYYALVVGHVEHPAVRREVTVCFIARLAVDRGAQGTGLGAVLLLDALERIATASELMAIRAVVVDAIDERAARFYEHFGVVRVTDQPRSLMVSLHLARAVLGESAT